MPIAQKLTSAITNPYSPTSVSGRARQKRWGRLFEAFPDFENMRVLDLGGNVAFWRGAPLTPKDLTILNRDDLHEGHVQGDALDPPAEVRGRRYDLVFSNSLLEHVGGHSAREQLARVVHELAPAHWVQTPYRYFPIEPHWLFPGMQFLPFAARVAVAERWPLGNMRQSNHGTATDAVHEVELVSITQMRSYFPDSVVWCEKLAGLPKSLVAIKS